MSKKQLQKIEKIKYSLPFEVGEISNRITYLAKQDIDFDVYLPSKGINLQRDLVWTIDQKRELIKSIFIGRHIPHISYINSIKEKDGNYFDCYQVIDGKQRLSTILQFLNNEFTALFEDEEFYFEELPEDYQIHFRYTYLRAHSVNESAINAISDQDKIDWFTYINFVGTPQDKEHLDKINK